MLLCSWEWFWISVLSPLTTSALLHLILCGGRDENQDFVHAKPKALPRVSYISSPQNRNFKRTIKGVGGHLLQRLLVFKTLINFKEFPYCCTSENDAFKTEMSSIMTETDNSNLNSMFGSVWFYSIQNDRIKVYIQSCYCNWGLKCHFCAGYFSGFVFNIHRLHVVLWAGRES